MPMAGTTQQVFNTQVPVSCGGVIVNPGDILFGDDDGIVVATDEELTNLLTTAEGIQTKETTALSRMEQGQSLLSMLNFSEHYAARQADRESYLRFVL